MGEQVGGVGMSVYKKSVICTGILTVFSISLAMILNYALNQDFWCNVCLGIFGSSLLSCITVVIGYFAEKRIVLEGFGAETHKLLYEFNKYQREMPLDDKIECFLNIIDYDTMTWGMYLGKIDFFDNRQRKYIYNEIYYPLLNVRKVITEHMWNFRMHKNGKVRNEAVMKTYVEEIELYILRIEKHHYRMENEQDYVTTSVSNRIVEDVLAELNGHYLEIMNGKKKE